MIRDLLMRWAHAAELADLHRQIRNLSDRLKGAQAALETTTGQLTDVGMERDALQARLDTLQPTPTEADIWQPEPGQRVTGESLVLGIDITGHFTRWQDNGYALLDGGRRVIGRTLRPADQ